MKARFLVRLDAEVGAAHGVSVETPAVLNAVDKLSEKDIHWGSQREAYSVEDEQLLEWPVEEECRSRSNGFDAPMSAKK